MPFKTHRVPIVYWLPPNSYQFNPLASTITGTQSGPPGPGGGPPMIDVLAAISFGISGGSSTASLSAITSLSVFQSSQGSSQVFTIPYTSISGGNPALYLRYGITANLLSWGPPATSPTMNLAFRLLDPTGNPLCEGTLYSIPTATPSQNPDGNFTLIDTRDNITPIWSAQGTWALTTARGWITEWIEAPYWVP